MLPLFKLLFGLSNAWYLFCRYDAELFTTIEDHINKNKEGNEDGETIKMTKFDVDKGVAMKLSDTVGQALAEARRVWILEILNCDIAWYLSVIAISCSTPC